MEGIAGLEKKIKEMELAYETRIKDLETKLATSTGTSGDQPQVSTSLPTLPVIPRKDFRIIGKIGDPGCKESLGFSSLVHQLGQGLKKGYPDTEIIAAVINAVSPSLSLRSYLEGKADLTLAKLRKVLRAHYQEKDATERYVQLTKLTQTRSESPQEFLLRALDVKQKILFASQEDEVAVRYEEQQVQALFVYALVTGLTNDQIKWEIERLVQEDEDASDETFLETVSKAAKQEAERQWKFPEQYRDLAYFGAC